MPRAPPTPLHPRTLEAHRDPLLLSSPTQLSPTKPTGPEAEIKVSAGDTPAWPWAGSPRSVRHGPAPGETWPFLPPGHSGPPASWEKGSGGSLQGPRCLLPISLWEKAESHPPPPGPVRRGSPFPSCRTACELGFKLSLCRHSLPSACSCYNRTYYSTHPTHRTVNDTIVNYLYMY